MNVFLPPFPNAQNPSETADDHAWRGQSLRGSAPPGGGSEAHVRGPTETGAACRARGRLFIRYTTRIHFLSSVSLRAYSGAWRLLTHSYHPSCSDSAPSSGPFHIGNCSGGQTEEQATQNLNLINQLAKQPASPFRPSSTTCPWILSFSFGRSLQASVLATWDGKDKNYEKAMEVAGALAKANAQAQLGEYQGPHPSVLKGQSLHETNRGWGANAGEGGGKGESTAGATATVPPSGETAA